jgi:hypothetical protein
VEQLILFTLVGAGLYLFCAWLLERIERARGARFEHRSLIFFAIILVLALVSFEFIGRFMR